MLKFDESERISIEEIKNLNFITLMNKNDYPNK